MSDGREDDSWLLGWFAMAMVVVLDGYALGVAIDGFFTHIRESPMAILTYGKRFRKRESSQSAPGATLSKMALPPTRKPEDCAKPPLPFSSSLL